MPTDPKRLLGLLLLLGLALTCSANPIPWEDMRERAARAQEVTVISTAISIGVALAVEFVVVYLALGLFKQKPFWNLPVLAAIQSVSFVKFWVVLKIFPFSTPFLFISLEGWVILFEAALYFWLLNPRPAKSLGRCLKVSLLGNLTSIALGFALQFVGARFVNY